mmetsp:Transcript_23353/g.54083  ORF Transcript_23353/g.54083 Transcript_23353/m.54083 type:complete len:261 (-) Transcript_23353:2340-3122(-)
MQSLITGGRLSTSSSMPSQASPPCIAICMIFRTRFLWLLVSGADHWPHAANSQSTFSYPGHTCGRAQVTSSVRPPLHCSPPPAAASANDLVRSFQPPPPQLRLQVDHSFHGEKAQSAFKWLYSQAMVSSMAPTHGCPSFSGCCAMVRERVRWDCEANTGHGLQPLHAEKAQSFGCVHSTGQLFVMSIGPLHGPPHSLLVTAITRSRSHKPTHVGSRHSPHSPNSQCRGTQLSQELPAAGHKVTFNCVPAHSDSPVTLKNH